jgi:hypothetical protein
MIRAGGPRRARTVDPRIKSPLLYRLSYRPQHSTGSILPLDKVLEFCLVPSSYYMKWVDIQLSRILSTK